MPPRIFLTKRYPLPALHQLRNENFSPEENLRTFGPCSRLHGHGYEIEVTISGFADPTTGILICRDELDRIVEDRILGPYTGSNLSLHFLHTTGEALAQEFFRLLCPQLPESVFLSALAVNETAKNSFSVGRDL